MEVFEFSKKLNIPKNSALCLGNFDGVHLGHRRLFHVAKGHKSWGALVFDGNFKGDKLITTLSEKLELIKNQGADFVICAKPDEGFLGLSGEQFYNILRDAGVGKLIAGYDFRFGKGAYHTCDDLVNWCKRDSIMVHIEGEYSFLGEAVKSSRIRGLIEKGEIPIANELLGYSYFLLGRVEKGLENGRKMGFPTANISYGDAKLLPPDGVYKGRIEIGENSYKAVINIGKNPTFDAKNRTVEVHIPNFEGDVYGESVRVEFAEKIRGEIKFGSVEELIAQIKRDVASALK